MRNAPSERLDWPERIEMQGRHVLMRLRMAKTYVTFLVPWDRDDRMASG